MSSKYYYDARDVARIINVSLGAAYKLLQRMNRELESDEQRFITIPGKIPREYFDKRLSINTKDFEKETK